MPESDYGWGDGETSGGRSFGGVGMAALVVASGLYSAAVWVASGLQPLPYFAARARKPRPVWPSSQGAQPHP